MNVNEYIIGNSNDIDVMTRNKCQYVDNAGF